MIFAHITLAYQYTLEDSKKLHAAELKKIEKDKNEKKREAQDLVSSIQEITQQNLDLSNSISEGEDSILIIYTDNQIAVEESVKVREELIARKKVPSLPRRPKDTKKNPTHKKRFSIPKILGFAILRYLICRTQWKKQSGISLEIGPNSW